MKRKKGQLLAEIRALLEDQPDGLDSATLADHCRMTRPRMAVELWCMRRDGHLRASGGRNQRWFVSPTAPASSAPDQLVTPRGDRRAAAIPVLEHVSVLGEPRTPDQVRALAEESGLVLAPNVKITVCPGGLDNRFSVDPRTFKGGESTADWQRRRQAHTETA